MSRCKSSYCCCEGERKGKELSTVFVLFVEKMNDFFFKFSKVNIEM